MEDHLDERLRKALEDLSFYTKKGPLQRRVQDDLARLIEEQHQQLFGSFPPASGVGDTLLPGALTPKTTPPDQPLRFEVRHEWLPLPQQELQAAFDDSDPAVWDAYRDKVLRALTPPPYFAFADQPAVEARLAWERDWNFEEAVKVFLRHQINRTEWQLIELLRASDCPRHAYTHPTFGSIEFDPETVRAWYAANPEMGTAEWTDKYGDTYMVLLCELTEERQTRMRLNYFRQHKRVI